MKLERDEGEIKNAISDQLLYITNSCFLYDKGCFAEAIRISGALNVLLENRQKSDGLLRGINFDFNLLSTVPDVGSIPIEKVVATRCKDLTKIKSESDSNKYFLTFIEDLNDWHIQAFDHKGNKISCLVGDLQNRLRELDLLANNQQILVPGCIRAYNEEDDFKNQRKEFIINHLDALLGYRSNYATGLYFPMIDKKTILEHIPKLDTAIYKKYLNIVDWLNEIIFAIPDEKRHNHTLTREQLIKSARDQDGGGHFDIKLDVASYYQSKYGQTLGKLDGEKITTKNFHLIMLRQLGYEILNSPSIRNYIQQE
jgi:hypothetical protein